MSAEQHTLERVIFSEETEPHWTDVCSCGERVTANDGTEVARRWFDHKAQARDV